MRTRTEPGSCRRRSRKCGDLHLGGERDSHGRKLLCGVREESWLSSLHEVLGDDSNAAQKLRCGFQVPVGRVDIDMSQVGSQGQHVPSDSLPISWRRLQCANCKGMTKLMNTRPSTAGGLDSCGFQQSPEHAVNFPVDEGLSFV